MGQVLKFPVQASKLGHKRVKKRLRAPDHPDQLSLFPQPAAQILDFTPDLSRFEQALLFDEREDSRAVELYKQAIEEGDCVADAYCNLGIIESKLGNAARAFDCFTTALQHNPRHAEAHFNLANLYFDASDLRLAQVHYEMAREVDPGFASVYFNLGLVLAINNEFSAAISALTKYQALVSQAEGRIANELLENLRRSVSKGSRVGSS